MLGPQNASQMSLRQIDKNTYRPVFCDSFTSKQPYVSIAEDRTLCSLLYMHRVFACCTLIDIS